MLTILRSCCFLEDVPTSLSLVHHLSSRLGPLTSSTLLITDVQGILPPVCLVTLQGAKHPGEMVFCPVISACRHRRNPFIKCLYAADRFSAATRACAAASSGIDWASPRENRRGARHLMRLAREPCWNSSRQGYAPEMVWSLIHC